MGTQQLLRNCLHHIVQRCSPHQNLIEVQHWILCVTFFRVPTLPWKPWNFVIYFSRPGKCLEFAQKVGKAWNFNSKPGKYYIERKFGVSRFTFQDVISKKESFTSFSYLHYQHKHCDFEPFDLEFHCFYMEITWKIHGILCHQRSGNPVFELSI